MVRLDVIRFIVGFVRVSFCIFVFVVLLFVFVVFVGFFYRFFVF